MRCMAFIASDTTLLDLVGDNPVFKDQPSVGKGPVSLLPWLEWQLNVGHLEIRICSETILAIDGRPLLDQPKVDILGAVDLNALQHLAV